MAEGYIENSMFYKQETKSRIKSSIRRFETKDCSSEAGNINDKENSVCGVKKCLVNEDSSVHNITENSVCDVKKRLFTENSSVHNITKPAEEMVVFPNDDHFLEKYQEREIAVPEREILVPITNVQEGVQPEREISVLIVNVQEGVQRSVSAVTTDENSVLKGFIFNSCNVTINFK